MGGGYPQLGSQVVKLDKDKLQLARLTGWRVAYSTSINIHLTLQLITYNSDTRC